MNATETIDPTLPSTFKGLLPALRVRPALGDSVARRVFRGGCQASPSCKAKAVGGAPPSLDSAAMQDAVRGACGSEPFARLADSPYFDSPLSALALIIPVAQKLAESKMISLAAARREVLSSLGLDGDVLHWSNKILLTVCQAAGVPPTFEGLCCLENQDLLSCVIIAGLGLEDTGTVPLWRDARPEGRRIVGIARTIADRHAPQPDAWVADKVLTQQTPIGNLAIRYVQISE
jgi:hypothetical protein